MNAELHAKILQDLQKSGFASEMRAIRAFRDAGWQCSGAGTYFDLDEGITRTIDLKAYELARDREIGDGGFEFEYELFVEVKKSERPWIVFRQAEISKGTGDAWENPFVSHHPACPLGELTPLLRQHSVRKKLGWMGYGVHESFKEPQDTGRWYAAAVSACKATYDFVRHEAFQHLDHMPKRTFLMMTHPVVIIDGPLWSAELRDGEDPNLEEIEFAPFNFEFGTANYKQKTYRVDLVRLESLTNYLKTLKERIDAITAHLRQSIMSSTGPRLG